MLVQLESSILYSKSYCNEIKAFKKYIICNMPKSLLNGISPLYSDKVKKKVLMRVKLTRVDLSSYVTETIPYDIKK